MLPSSSSEIAFWDKSVLELEVSGNSESQNGGLNGVSLLDRVVVESVSSDVISLSSEQDNLFFLKCHIDFFSFFTSNRCSASFSLRSCFKVTISCSSWSHKVKFFTATPASILCSLNIILFFMLARSSSMSFILFTRLSLSTLVRLGVPSLPSKLLDRDFPFEYVYPLSCTFNLARFNISPLSRTGLATLGVVTETLDDVDSPGEMSPVCTYSKLYSTRY